MSKKGRFVFATTLLLLLFALFNSHAQTSGMTPTSPPLGAPQTPAALPSFPSKQQYDFLAIVFSGMTAIGTIAVALLAIFGQRIRNFIVRPKLSLSVGKKPPFVALLEEPADAESGTTQKSFHIQVRVDNSGKETARNCIVLCDRIWRERPGSGFYVLKDMVPRPFLWTSNIQKCDVVPKLPTYLQIAKISESAQTTASSSDTSFRPTSDCLYLFLEAEGVPGRFFRTDAGKILLPLLVYADNLPRSLKYYVEIYWTGISCQDVTDANFAVRLIQEAEGDRLVGGAP